MHEINLIVLGIRKLEVHLADYCYILLAIANEPLPVFFIQDECFDEAPIAIIRYKSRHPDDNNTIVWEIEPFSSMLVQDLTRNLELGHFHFVIKEHHA